MLKLKAARRSFFRRIWLTGAMLRAPARVEQELPVIAFLNTMQDEIPQWVVRMVSAMRDHLKR
jgi:hypothetical protein